MLSALQIFNALRHDIPFLVAPIFILLFYTSWIFRRDDNSSHMGMAAIAILNIVLAIGASIGLTLLTGSPFTALNAVAIFITFGIGIDDAFIIASAAHDDEAAEHDTTIRDKVVRGIRKAGPSILLTSVTDFAAFVSNYSSNVYGIREFSKVAGLMVLVDFLFQITFFLASLFLDFKRVKSGKRDVVCCLKSSRPTTEFGVKNRGERGKQHRWISNFVIVKWLPRIILSRVGKFAALASTLALFILGVVGAKKLTINYSVFDLVPTDSFVHEGRSTMDKYFPNMMQQAYVCAQAQAKHANYARHQDELLEMEMAACGQAVSPDKCFAWYSPFRLWMIGKYADSLDSAFDEDGFVREDMFYGELAEFHKDGLGHSLLNSFVRWGDTNVDIVASKVCFLYRKSLSAGPDINFMLNIRENMISLAPGLDPHVYARYFFSIEPLSTLVQSTINSFSLMLLVVIFVCMVILGDVAVASVVVGSVLVIEVIMLGAISYFGYEFNMMTAVNLIVSVGLCVDFSAHVAHAFLHARGGGGGGGGGEEGEGRV